MKKALSWFVGVGWLLLLTAPSQAQISNNYLIDYTREGAWRYTHQPETLYQTNGRLIQQQLRVIGKRLNHLSVVDPPTYSQLQSELNGYLWELERHPIDYGQAEVYHALTLQLVQLDERIRAGIQHRADQPVPADNGKTQEGAEADVLPYALLFRRADYRSRLVHVVTTGKVTILKNGPIYCLVQYGPYVGYLYKGMIL